MENYAHPDIRPCCFWSHKRVCGSWKLNEAGIDTNIKNSPGKYLFSEFASLPFLFNVSYSKGGIHAGPASLM